MEKQGTIVVASEGRPPLGSLPVLVYDHGADPNNRQTAFAIGDRSHHTQVVPELADLYHVTQHGWVFLHDPDLPRTRLWDPRSGETIPLPAMDRSLPQNWKCFLSDVPTARSCVVLVIDLENPILLYCRIGDDDSWTVHEYDIGELGVPPDFDDPQKLAIKRIAAVGGKFYFEEMRGLGVIDFSSASSSTPEFSYLEYPGIEFPAGANAFRTYLVESGGELFNVYVFIKGFITPEILKVSVFRIDLPGPEPGTITSVSEVDDIGDRVFLLSYPNAQTLCPASKYGVKGNHVYLVLNIREEPDGGILHIYNLDDGSIESLRPCQDMAELLRNPFWMLPTNVD